MSNSKPQFTPGPWVVTTETRLHVATPGDLNSPLNPANAALIAAAPDLFKALTDALELLENAYTVDMPNGRESTHPLIPGIRAALAKAVTV